MQEITTKEIMKITGVSHRTLFDWVRRGLLIRPEKISRGRGTGVIGMWPSNVIPRVKILMLTRSMPLTNRLDILKSIERVRIHTPAGNQGIHVTPVIYEEEHQGRFYKYRFTEDGDVLVSSRKLQGG